MRNFFRVLFNLPAIIDNLKDQIDAVDGRVDALVDDVNEIDEELHPDRDDERVGVDAAPDFIAAATCPFCKSQFTNVFVWKWPFTCPICTAVVQENNGVVDAEIIEQKVIEVDVTDFQGALNDAVDYDVTVELVEPCGPGGGNPVVKLTGDTVDVDALLATWGYAPDGSV